MDMNSDRLKGVFAPVVTPFKNDELRLDWLEENLGRLAETELAGYLALGTNGEFKSLTEEEKLELRAAIQFQYGPVKQQGANGISNEALLAIVLDRLARFQMGKFRCKENDEAMQAIHKGLYWLRQRTESRMARGVEGTSEQ